MAGYVFAIGNNTNPVEIIKKCAQQGVYSTFLKSLSSQPFEGTLADYISMKPGDNIYFFCKRKYYGIGEIVNTGLDCKYCNYPGSTELKEFDYDSIKDNLLVNNGQKSNNNRWLCTFKGSPYFFEEGIDTDEILKYKPNTFKMLRAFWKLSFIKLGDEENESLKEIFLLRHQKQLEEHTGIFPEENTFHQAISNHENLSSYIINPKDLLKSLTNSDGNITHEMALEAGVVYDLCKNNIDVLGCWNFVSHQVIASPFKPIDYMDKIDVFATRYLQNTKIPCKYLVAELKKDGAGTDSIDQVLKYVDWVCSEYTYGNYDAIEACIIASSFDDMLTYFTKTVKRFYTVGSHPAKNGEWNKLKLIRYKCENGNLSYLDVTPNIQ